MDAAAASKIAALEAALADALRTAEAYREDLAFARDVNAEIHARAELDAEELDAVVAELAASLADAETYAAAARTRAESDPESEDDDASADDSSIAALEAELASLRAETSRLVSTLENVKADATMTERNLRRELTAAKAAAVRAEELEETKTALEARLADADATLAAERARAQAEANAARHAADAEATTLREKLAALEETVASRDAALVEAETSAEALRAAAADLERRLKEAERERDAAAALLEPEIERLRGDAEEAARRLQEREHRLAAALDDVAAADEKANAAEEAAEALRWQLVAKEEVDAATAKGVDAAAKEEADAAAKEEVDAAAKDIAAKDADLRVVSEELRRRAEETRAVSDARGEEIKRLAEENGRLEAELAVRRADVDDAERASEAEAKVIQLRDQLETLAERSAELEAALAEKEAIDKKDATADGADVDAGSVVAGSGPTSTPGGVREAVTAVVNAAAAAAARVFADPETESAMLAASAEAARLEILLRQRERALAEVERMESEGAAVGPVLESYKVEISQLEAEAAAARAELARRDDVVAELSGRLDVELNLLRRESGKLKRRLLSESAERGDEIRDGDSPERIEDLEEKLDLAQMKSTDAFDALSSTLGSARAEIVVPGFTDAATKTVDVRFSIPFETTPGQDLFVVGTWCDWDVAGGLPLTWTEGGVWVGTMPLLPGYNYEYKYCVLETQHGQQPGEPLRQYPEWGFAEPTTTPSPVTGATCSVVWQKGNNKAMALDNIATNGIAHIQINDEWIPNPKNSPIQLVGEDGEVKEEVGSTKLLMECVHRADDYLAEVREQMEEMYKIATASLGYRKGRTNVDDEDDDDDDDAGLIIA